jgi:hypothetical protein
MWSIYFRKTGTSDDLMLLGKAKVVTLTQKNGQTITLGKPEDIFDSEMTELDKELLKGIKIEI